MLSTLHTLSHLLLPPVTLSSRYYHSLHFTRKETEAKFNPWLLATQLTNDRTRMGTQSLQASRAPAIPRSSAPACVCLLTKKGCNSKEEAFLAGLCSGPFSRAGEMLDHIIFSSGSQLTTSSSQSAPGLESHPRGCSLREHSPVIHLDAFWDRKLHENRENTRGK